MNDQAKARWNAHLAAREACPIARGEKAFHDGKPCPKEPQAARGWKQARREELQFERSVREFGY